MKDRSLLYPRVESKQSKEISIIKMSTSVNLYPDVTYTGQYAPDSFGPEVDNVCTEIHAATNGPGTNETYVFNFAATWGFKIFRTMMLSRFYFLCKYYTNRRLLKALGGCNGEMRSKVPDRFFQMYHKDLLSLMKSECGSRGFCTAVQYLAVDPVHAECLMIEDACKGFGTNELFLFSIICGRSNQDIELLKVRIFVDLL